VSKVISAPQQALERVRLRKAQEDAKTAANPGLNRKGSRVQDSNIPPQFRPRTSAGTVNATWPLGEHLVSLSCQTRRLIELNHCVGLCLGGPGDAASHRGARKDSVPKGGAGSPPSVHRGSTTSGAPRSPPAGAVRIHAADRQAGGGGGAPAIARVGARAPVSSSNVPRTPVVVNEDVGDYQQYEARPATALRPVSVGSRLNTAAAKLMVRTWNLDLKMLINGTHSCNLCCI